MRQFLRYGLNQQIIKGKVLWSDIVKKDKEKYKMRARLGRETKRANHEQ